MENIKTTTKYSQAIKIILISLAFAVTTPIVAFADYPYGGNTNDYPNGGNYVTYPYGGNSTSYTEGGNYVIYPYGGNSDLYTLGGNNSDYPYGGNDYDYPYGGNDSDYPYGGNNYDDYPYGGNTNDYNVPINYSNGINFNGGGNYNGGYNYGQPSYYYYGPGFVGTGSSGGITYGPNTPVTIPVYPSMGTTTFGGGSFEAGTSTYVTPPVYPGMGTTTFGGGSFEAGTSTYVTPPVYPGMGTTTGNSGGVTFGSNNSLPPATYDYSSSYTVMSGSISGANSYPYYNYNQPYYNQPTNAYYNQPTNQVLAYTDTKQTPTLDSVYLSDVPYTGLSDYYGIIIFVSILVFWSAILAYIFLKRKIESETLVSEVYVNESETKLDSNNPVVTNLFNQTISDNSDVIKVEEYARMNKVLLSSDASAKLVKLYRLGKMNVSEYIRSVATGEWVAVGENQIK